VCHADRQGISRDGRGQRSSRSATDAPKRERTERRLRAALSWTRYPALSAQIAYIWAGSGCCAMLRAQPVHLGCLVDPGRPPLPGFGVTWPGGLACRAR
jgi:hypothetical protein